MVAYIHTLYLPSVRLPHSFIYLLCVPSYTKHFCSKMESLGNAVIDNGLYSLWEVWTFIFHSKLIQFYISLVSTSVITSESFEHRLRR